VTTSAPLVSVSCPTFQHRHFVIEALESIASQDYPNLEIIVADDGSTDGTIELVREFQANSKVPVTLVAESHVGVTRNVNRGLAKCRGEFLSFMAGDDIMLPGKIRRQVDWFQERPSRVLCGHDVEYFESSTGASLGLWSERWPMVSGRGIVRPIGSTPYCGSAVMVRRECMPSVGFDPRLETVSDTKLWVDLLHPDGEYGFVPGVLARYRRHGANVTNTSNAAHRAKLSRETLLVLDLIAAERPELASECRRVRDVRVFADAMRGLRGEDPVSALRLALHALARSPGAILRRSLSRVLGS
jgi:glycosyltransferase involved in cell wall biosynthesis